MVRRKVKLAFIENGSCRKVTYKKRVKGLVKKTQELSVLCDVDACTIVYGPYDEDPVVWPSSEAEAERIISSFKENPEANQCERRLDQEAYLKLSVNKAQDKLHKLQKKNREMEMENTISDIFCGNLKVDQVPPTNLGDMICVIDQKLKIIQHRLGASVNNVNVPFPHIPSANGDDNHKKFLISTNGDANQNPPTNPIANDGGDHSVISTNEEFSDGIIEDY